MSLTPSFVDGTIFFILLIFAVLAFLKGFIKDFFSTINLLLATIASYVFPPIISKLFIKGDSSSILTDVGISFAVFVICLIIGSIIISRISTPLSAKIPDAVNQSLGLGLGFAKGYFILSFVFAIFLSMYSGSAVDKPKKDKPIIEKIGPNWLCESKSYGILLFGADIIKPFIDRKMDQINNDNNSGVKDNKALGSELESLDQIIKNNKMYDELLDGKDSKAVPATKKEAIDIEIKKDKTEDKIDQKEESGQTRQEIEKMKRLIEIMSN